MKKISKVFNTYSAIVLVILLSIFTFLPLLHSGFFPMHDDTQVARVFEMTQSLKDGVFPVRWVKDLGYGYGYPIFNFYSPLPYYIGGVLGLFGLDALFATKAVFIFALIFSGVSMFLLVKSLYGNLSGIVAAAVYMYFPYHAINTYVRGDLDELLAYSFIPLVFLGFNKISQTPSLKWVFITSLSIFLVIISHNLTAFIMLFFVLIFFLVSILHTKDKRRYLISFATACLLGFIASSFYSIPAVFELSYTNVISQIGGGAHFSDHFVCPDQLWNSPWGFGGSTRGCLDGVSFKLSKTNIILVVLVFLIALYKIKKAKKNMFFLFAFASFLFSIFIVTNYSEFLWRAIPFSSFIQYPWRFLNFTSFSISIIAGFLFVELGWFTKNKTILLATGAVIITLTVFFNAKLFKPQVFYERSVNYYTNKPYLTWDVSKISDEYMPRNFKKPILESDVPQNLIEVTAGKASINKVSQKSQNISASIFSEGPSKVRVNKAPFPGWMLKVNGVNKDVLSKRDGIYLNLNPGQNIISLVLRQTMIEKISNSLSVIGLLAIFIGIMISPKVGTKKRNDSKTT